MGRERINFLFLNIGHYLDHLFVLIFATVAALALVREWNMSYAALIPYATPAFVIFGVGALPAGWIADRWSREGMMVVFFVGIGVSAMLTALAETPLQIGTGLFVMGMFAAIYHPVGLAMVIQGRERTGVPLAINGIFGNMGVASAALIAGALIDFTGWRSAFVWPGVISVAVGIAYAAFVYVGGEARVAAAQSQSHKNGQAQTPTLGRQTMVRVFAIIFFSAGVGGLVFQSATFAMPKVFDERLGDLAGTATLIGWYAFLVLAVAAFAQLVVGYLVDRYSIRTVFAFVAVLQAVFFALMYELTGVPALAVAICFMLVVFGQIPINDVLIGRIARGEWRSRAYAARYIVTFSVSATAVPLIAGVHAAWGFATLFLMLAAAAAAIFAAVLMLPNAPAVTGQQTAVAAE